MSKFEFPRKPEAGRAHRFEGSDGRNPFADEPTDAGEAMASQADPYAAAGSRGRTYQPSDFHTQYPHRGGTIAVLGRIALPLAVAGAAAGLLAAASSGDWSWSFLVSLPLQLLSLSLSIPAWLLGSRDLGAMRAGAMDAAGERLTRQGLRLGRTAVLLSAMPVLVLLVSLAAGY